MLSRHKCPFLARFRQVPVGAVAQVYLPLMGVSSSDVQVAESGTIVFAGGKYQPGPAGITGASISGETVMVSVRSRTCANYDPLGGSDYYWKRVGFLLISGRFFFNSRLAPACTTLPCTIPAALSSQQFSAGSRS